MLGIDGRRCCMAASRTPRKMLPGVILANSAKNSKANPPLLQKFTFYGQVPRRERGRQNCRAVLPGQGARRPGFGRGGGLPLCAGGWPGAWAAGFVKRRAFLNRSRPGRAGCVACSFLTSKRNRKTADDPDAAAARPKGACGPLWKPRGQYCGQVNH